MIESDAYWKEIERVEQRGGFDPPASAEEVKALRRSAFRKLFSLLTKPALNSGPARLERAERILALARTIRVTEAFVRQLEEELLAPLVPEFKDLCGDIAEDSSSHRFYRVDALAHDQIICEEAELRYESEVAPRLERLLRAASSSRKLSGELCDIAAICLDRLALDYQQVGRMEKAIGLLERSAALAGGRSVTSRVEDHLSEVRAMTHNETLALEDFAGLSVLISRRSIRIGHESMKIKEITGIRHSPIPGPGKSGGHIELTNGRRILSLDDTVPWAMWTDRSKRRVGHIVEALWKALGAELIERRVREFKVNGGVSIAGVQFDRQGLRRQTPANPLLQKVVTACLSLLEGESHDGRESADAFLPWSEFGGHTIESGHIVLHRRKNAWARLSLRQEWNAVLVAPLLNRLNQESLVPECDWKTMELPPEIAKKGEAVLLSEEPPRPLLSDHE